MTSSNVSEKIGNENNRDGEEKKATLGRLKF